MSARFFHAFYFFYFTHRTWAQPSVLRPRFARPCRPRSGTAHSLDTTQGYRARQTNLRDIVFLAGLTRVLFLHAGLFSTIRHVLAPFRTLSPGLRVLLGLLYEHVGRYTIRNIPALYAPDAVHVLALATFTADAQFFLRWLRRLLLRVSFWSYRRLFTFFHVLLTQWAALLGAHRGSGGFVLIWRGKINIAGNGRTRTFRVRVGHSTLARTGQRTSVARETVSTFTGVIGLTFISFF